MSKDRKPAAIKWVNAPGLRKWQPCTWQGKTLWVGLDGKARWFTGENTTGIPKLYLTSGGAQRVARRAAKWGAAWGV
jgi:hypothetical protein